MQAARKAQGSDALQQYQQLQQALLQLVKHAISGHLWNSHLPFERLANISLEGILQAWEQLYVAEMTDADLDALIIILLSRFLTVMDSTMGKPSNTMFYMTPWLWRFACELPPSC